MEQRVTLCELGGLIESAVPTAGIDDQDLCWRTGRRHGVVEVFEGLGDRQRVVQRRDYH